MKEVCFLGIAWNAFDAIPKTNYTIVETILYEISDKRGIEQKEWAARYCAEIVTCHSQNFQISLELAYKR